MKPAALIARVAEAGFRVELTPSGPAIRREAGTGNLPAPLLADLKEHRNSLIRHLATTALLARACERVVWGLLAGEPGPVRMKGRVVPATWAYACVEGDSEWTPLPRVESDASA